MALISPIDYVPFIHISFPWFSDSLEGLDFSISGYAYYRGVRLRVI